MWKNLKGDADSVLRNIRRSSKEPISSDMAYELAEVVSALVTQVDELHAEIEKLKRQGSRMVVQP